VAQYLMTHPDVAAVGYVTDVDTFNVIWDPRGWVLGGTVGGSPGYSGATEDGPPTTGAYEPGDFVVAEDATVWVCTVAGSPGTWVQANSGSYAPLGELVVVGASGQAFTATTTLATVTDLTAPVMANQTYLVDGAVAVTGAPAGDVKLSLAVVDGGGVALGDAAGNGTVGGGATSTDAGAGSIVWGRTTINDSGNARGLNGPTEGEAAFISFSFIVNMGDTAGTVALKAAQNVSDATATTILADSWMRVTPAPLA
jgi:hypothetical protein